MSTLRDVDGEERAMNPDKNKFEPLREICGADEALRKKVQELKDELSCRVLPTSLVRADGSPIPKHWSVFSVGEQVAVKNYTFKVAHIGESYLSRLRNGKRSNPTPETVMKISLALVHSNRTIRISDIEKLFRSIGRSLNLKDYYDPD